MKVLTFTTAPVCAEVVAARQIAEARIRQRDAAIRAEAQKSLSAAEEDLQARARARAVVRENSGSKTRTRLSKALMAPETLGTTDPLWWQPGVSPLPAISGEIGVRGPKVLGAARRRQAAQLSRERARLAAQLHEATSLAVLKVAGMEDLIVHLPPVEEASGANLTEYLRPTLRAFFRQR